MKWINILSSGHLWWVKAEREREQGLKTIHILETQIIHWIFSEWIHSNGNQKISFFHKLHICRQSKWNCALILFFVDEIDYFSFSSPQFHFSSSAIRDSYVYWLNICDICCIHRKSNNILCQTSLLLLHGTQNRNLIDLEISAKSQHKSLRVKWMRSGSVFVSVDMVIIGLFHASGKLICSDFFLLECFILSCLDLAAWIFKARILQFEVIVKEENWKSMFYNQPAYVMIYNLQFCWAWSMFHVSCSFH